VNEKTMRKIGILWKKSHKKKKEAKSQKALFFFSLIKYAAA